MRRIKYSTKRYQIRIKKSNFGKLNLENHVIDDANKVICNKKLGDIEQFRRYWHWK